MLIKLFGGLVVIVLHRRFFEGAVEALDLTIRLGMGWLGQAMLRTKCSVHHHILGLYI